MGRCRRKVNPVFLMEKVYKIQRLKSNLGQMDSKDPDRGIAVTRHQRQILVKKSTNCVLFEKSFPIAFASSLPPLFHAAQFTSLPTHDYIARHRTAQKSG